MRRIGLFGGTFDPPHIGHLIIAEEIYEQLQLDEIWFIPTYVPPHKDTKTTDSNHRKNMVERSIRGNPHFRLETIELERAGISYTLDTIKALKEDYPDDDFYFIIGGDMVEYLPHWHKIDELVSLVQFVGVERQGYPLSSPYPIKFVNVPIVEISSSRLRERLEAGRPVYYWMKEDVLDYIREKGLYGFE
ncbi:nicotinate-nucleotide adenylyltransferase [Salinibacillus aidingensis]|uniref:Probable nicotinate-nucleotide adenylyltransferase n=1 Tax=Salinibacillus aidingensis TaxID=237684 RepID=A0ABN1ASF3_9BACI